MINLKQWLPLGVKGGQRMGEGRKQSTGYVLPLKLDNGMVDIHFIIQL